jgi:hypothetical protein
MQIFVGLENCRDNWWDPYIGRRPNPLVGGWATHTQKMLSIRDRVSSYGWRLKKALKFQCTHTPLSGPASSLKMLRMHRLTFRFLDSYKYILYMMDIDMDMDIDIYIFIYIYIYIRYRCRYGYRYRNVYIYIENIYICGCGIYPSACQCIRCRMCVSGKWCQPPKIFVSYWIIVPGELQ